MGETVDLVEMVVRTANDDSTGARALAVRLLADEQLSPAFEARIYSMLVFADYIDSNYTDAVVTAERAVRLATDCGDHEALIYAHACRLLASCGTAWAGTDPDVDHFAIAWSMRAVLDGLEPSSRMIAGHMLVEAVLCTGRMSEALELLDQIGDVRLQRSESEQTRHPYLPFMQLQPVRVLYFQGRVTEALPLLHEILLECDRTGNSLWTALAHGFLAVMAAHRGDRPATREHVDRSLAPFPNPQGYLGGAVYAVCAYALFAIGDVVRASELAVRGGGDSDLSRLQVGDRALCFDLLASAALDAGDLATAEEWGNRSFSIAAHPAAAPIVEQLRARLDLARGESASSAERAEISAARSRLTGRYLEASYADLLRARALAASGLTESAIRGFTDVAHDAERDGLNSFRSTATSELRRLGRRLQPLPGSGWGSLSERERQIAVLAAEGFSNRVIGDSLFLSQRTVQTYMSRVLAALGVATRTALPAKVAEHRLGSPRDDLPQLTARQRQVAELIASGASNRQIALELAISVKTVEKHIGEMLVRWDVASRTAIASIVVAESGRESA